MDNLVISVLVILMVEFFFTLSTGNITISCCKISLFYISIFAPPGIELFSMYSLISVCIVHKHKTMQSNDIIKTQLIVSILIMLENKGILFGV